MSFHRWNLLLSLHVSLLKLKHVLQTTCWAAFRQEQPDANQSPAPGMAPHQHYHQTLLLMVNVMTDQPHAQEAEEQLDEGKFGFVEASALTHKQVLEMAVAEASRRVHKATKYVLLFKACPTLLTQEVLALPVSGRPVLFTATAACTAESQTCISSCALLEIHSGSCLLELSSAAAETSPEGHVVDCLAILSLRLGCTYWLCEGQCPHSQAQVDELAVAEASRCACRQVADAEADAAKKAEERAKVWKTHAGSNSTSPNTTPNTSVEIVPRNASVTSSKTEPNPWSQPVKAQEGEFSHDNACKLAFVPSFCKLMLVGDWYDWSHCSKAGNYASKFAG